VIDATSVRRWVEGYERAWRTAGTDGLADLFTDGATYQMAPFQEPHRGLPAIAALWDAERRGPDEAFTMEWSLVAVDDPHAVVRVEVRYGAPTPAWYRDLWVLDLAPDGRCRVFEEWPFSPERSAQVGHPPT
jgi:ketosteroid isomerase-like protein